MSAAKVESVKFEDVAKEVSRITPQSVFETLNAINVADKIEKKNGLSYLSWAWAWAEVKKQYPDANYTIYERETTHGPVNYFTDGRTCWVKTGVIINDMEHIEELPVMDYKNKSILLDNVTSFDVNKAIQRSLTKALARHGLGLYIYAGEDLPETKKETKDQQADKGESTPPKAEVTGAMLMEFKDCQQQLADLGADIHSESFMQWMADHTGYGDQNADIQDPVKMQKLITAYKSLIAVKMKAKAEANANTAQA